MIKYSTIYLDGIDKTGKDLIAKYVAILSNGKYIVNARGIQSVLAYSILYNRNFVYNLDNEKYNINVYLKVNKDDWKIRCKLTNEPTINFEDNVKVFDEAFEIVKQISNTMEFNTSEYTPYKIARFIVNYAEDLNNKEN